MRTAAVVAMRGEMLAKSPSRETMYADIRAAKSSTQITWERTTKAFCENLSVSALEFCPH